MTGKICSYPKCKEKTRMRDTTRKEQRKFNRSNAKGQLWECTGGHRVFVYDMSNVNIDDREVFSHD